MREHDFRPNKRLGQDFLIDKNIADKIIRFADLGPDDTVVEIGAGLGNITAEIASAAKKVIAVEYDKRFFEMLRANPGGYKNIDFICADILDFNFRSYSLEDKLKIIGNVPYYITTPIIEHILKYKDCIRTMVLMVQKEVGERMLAREGSKTYSPLSCYIQYYTKPEFKTVVKRTSFFPVPEVDSALIYFDILERPSVAVKDEKLFFKVIRSSFNQRRKTLLASLRHRGALNESRERVSELLKRAGVDPQARPETLSLQEFARIADQVAGLQAA